MENRRIINRIVCFIVISLLCVSMTGCKKETAETASLWDNAVYSEDKTFGNGKKTIQLEVKAEEKSVTFTIKTDADNLEEALVKHKLIEGEEGPYGMYIKKVNGITADYDVDQSYWALSQKGTPLATGASGVEIKGGEHFEFIHTR